MKWLYSHNSIVSASFASDRDEVCIRVGEVLYCVTTSYTAVAFDVICLTSATDTESLNWLQSKCSMRLCL